MRLAIIFLALAFFVLQRDEKSANAVGVTGSSLGNIVPLDGTVSRPSIPMHLSEHS